MRWLLFLINSFFISLFSLSGFAAERVISLSPAATELLYAAGLGDKLIAASEHSDYPPQAKELERVGSFNSINIERIITLQPDLIVVWRSGGQGKALNKLKDLGFTIQNSGAETLEQIAVRIEELSVYAEDPTVGKQNAAAFRQRLSELKKQYNTSRPTLYFYQIGSNPIYTVTEGHWPSEVFSICGGENIFQHSSVAYPQVNMEQILVRQPDIIFASSHADSDTDIWLKWTQLLPAVAKKQIWSLNPDWINRPTPRSLKAVEEVCGYFEKVRNAERLETRD